MEEIASDLPKGRGRGRGGVPLLPTGLWQSLHGGDEDRNNNNNHHESDEKVEKFLKEVVQPQFEDITEKKSHSEHHHETGGEFGNIKGFSKDLKGKDWDCPSCSNTNWSWRGNCNKCGTAKPFIPTGDGEFRDGAGGGFNERQDRVSAAAVEVDEEGFDDFGRRVKKEKQAADRKAKEEAALKRLSEKYQYLLPGTVGTMHESYSSNSSSNKNVNSDPFKWNEKSNERKDGNSFKGAHEKDRSHNDGNQRNGRYDPKRDQNQTRNTQDRRNNYSSTNNRSNNNHGNNNNYQHKDSYERRNNDSKEKNRDRRNRSRSRSRSRSR